MFGAAGRALALLLSAAVLTPSLVRAGAASCSVHVGKDDYDLSALSAVQTFERERDTPPTVMVDRVRMMLCGGNDAGLPHEEGFESVDECPTGTYVCLQVQNKKAGAEPALRTVHVIPVVKQTEEGATSPMNVDWSTTTEEVKGYPKKVPTLVGRLTGGEWASNSQTLAIHLRCVGADDSEDAPVLVDYSDNWLRVDWNTQHACPRGPDSPPPGSSPSDKSAGGGRGFWGWLFLLLLFVPPIYLALGIYHNRTTYDARGWDAVPNREFWEELPANVRDLLGHVFGSVRRRSGGGGGSSRQGYETL